MRLHLSGGGGYWLQMIAIIFAYKDSKIRSSEVYLGHKLHSTQWDFAPLARFFPGWASLLNMKTYHN